MTTEHRVILVTGGNRGIGYEICKGILSDPSSASSPVKVIVGSRDATNGEKAVDELTPFAPSGSTITTIQLDVTSDESIASACQNVGKLDVLILNAAVGILPKGLSDLRRAYNDSLNANVASVGLCIEHFAPLLQQDSIISPRIIVVSSARGSLERSSDPNAAPTRSLPYSVSKAAVNMQVVDYGKRFNGTTDGMKKIKVWATNPGYCKTAFNNYTGTKDPADGAKSTVILACSSAEEAERYEVGRMWEYEGAEMRAVPF